ncbi:MAG: transketolase [Deltaproteobacteria bacterium]|nr:transketolase [Deltaproteobacteria bacterium]
MSELNKPANSNNEELDRLAINSIRFLALDAIDKANSGHPGMPLGAAPMAYALWSRFLKFNSRNPAWPNRDRFVLSAGHASALLYSLLHHAGYDLTLDEIKNFRQWGSKTPGHPEFRHTPGVEVTTGPLGQGFAMAVGMAIAERHLAARFNRENFDIVDHRTFVLASDGDLMEGVVSEAASLAGHLRLGKLICLYDSNNISLSGPTHLTFSEDTAKKFEALHWQVLKVEDGNDLKALESAIAAACSETLLPSLIIVKSHIGFGSPKFQDSHEAHGSPLGAEETLATKKSLGWPHKETFFVPDPVRELFVAVARSGITANSEWDGLLRRYTGEFPGLREEWDRLQGGALTPEWENELTAFAPGGKPVATRTASGQILNHIAQKVDNLVGGSADLDPSTKTVMKKLGFFQSPATLPPGLQNLPEGGWSYSGRNLSFGVREHAMGSILNGIAAHGGLRPYGSTFLVFSDYLRPAIRLAALMKLPVIYLFTHDSIAVGEDGPTHQPVEQTASLRAIPGLAVIRPADANETLEAWKYALKAKETPTAFILSRQDLPILDRSKYASASGLHQGAYILAGSGQAPPELILIAAGAELFPALEAYERLVSEGISARLVSMPSWELFEAQPLGYRDEIFPPAVKKRIAVEAGCSQGWHRYVGLEGVVIGVDRFGASAPGGTALKNFGFTVEEILAKAKNLL